MKKENIFGIWLRQIRAPFLILSVFLVLIGVAAAYREGFVNWLHTVLLFAGVVLAHISVNLFNELSDFDTKIDELTSRTPFSGGSGMLQSGKSSPKAVSKAAFGTLIAAGLIGIYFCLLIGWLILILMVLGAVAIKFYTSHLAKWLVGELSAGLTLGSFVVLGSYYVLTANITFEIILISIPPGILTFLLLLLNEFPDLEADKVGGRHHLVIYFGKQKCSWIYVAGLILVYGLLLIAPLISDIPYSMLVSLLTIPIAFKAGLTVVKSHDDANKLIPALGLNSLGVVLLTDLLIAIGFLI